MWLSILAALVRRYFGFGFGFVWLGLVFYFILCQCLFVSDCLCLFVTDKSFLYLNIRQSTACRSQGGCVRRIVGP
jgi:hypothetical protein